MATCLPGNDGPKNLQFGRDVEEWVTQQLVEVTTTEVPQLTGGQHLHRAVRQHLATPVKQDAICQLEGTGEHGREGLGIHVLHQIL